MLLPRASTLRQSRLAPLLVAAALLLKVLVPSGFMPVVTQGHLQIALCTGTGPIVTTIAVPTSKDGKGAGGRHDGAHKEQPCAFSALAHAALGAVDAVLLAIALLFVMAVALRPSPGLFDRSPRRLRPPLRGPPALA